MAQRKRNTRAASASDRAAIRKLRQSVDRIARQTERLAATLTRLQQAAASPEARRPVRTRKPRA